MIRILLLMNIFIATSLYSVSHRVQTGIDVLSTSSEFDSLLKGKKVGLITNHTGINGEMESTIDVLKGLAKTKGFTLQALFAPEHGLTGSAHNSVKIGDGVDSTNTPIFSLYGTTHRPTPEMLKNINLLIYDIQDVGSRSYTYSSTLYYAMEEAAKHHIPVVVLDRPNPINGVVVDGPLMEEKWRSIVGYLNVPYCHGMTIGELAKFFNEEYSIHCELSVVPMKGWERKMSFEETGLPWIPTSPNIPEATTAFFYPMTGILGELQLVNIGVGYTLPFKVVGAPWIDGEEFASKLNGQRYPGVYFQPFHYEPFYGRFVKESCHGVLIIVTDPLTFQPVSTQYLIIGMLKSLYPEQFQEAFVKASKRKSMFCKVNGTEEVYRLIKEGKHIVWKLKELHQKEREAFMKKRKKYLIREYEF